MTRAHGPLIPCQVLNFTPATKRGSSLSVFIFQLMVFLTFFVCACNRSDAHYHVDPTTVRVPPPGRNRNQHASHTHMNEYYVVRGVNACGVVRTLMCIDPRINYMCVTIYIYIYIYEYRYVHTVIYAHTLFLHDAKLIESQNPGDVAGVSLYLRRPHMNDARRKVCNTKQYCKA